MKEIQVITDVRLSADSAELILARQTLVAEDGEFRPVGDPVESRLSLLTPRAKLSFGVADDTMVGLTAFAHVQNVSLVPFEITDVRLSFEYPEPRVVKVGQVDAQETGGSFQLVPKDWKPAGALIPRGTRDFYLTAKLMDVAKETMTTVPEANVKVLVYSGADVVGEAPGRDLLALVDMVKRPRPGTVRFAGRIRHTLNGMDAETQDRIKGVLADLAAMTVDQWGDFPGHLSKTEGDMYFLSVPPDFKILLRPLRPGGIEVLDVIRVREPKGIDVKGGAVGARE